jgi:hypothetical protein
MRRFQPAATSVFAVFRLLPPALSTAGSRNLTYLRRSTVAPIRVASGVIFRAQTRSCLTPCIGSRLRPGERLIDPSTAHVGDLEAPSIISEGFPTSGRRTTYDNAKPAIA